MCKNKLSCPTPNKKKIYNMQEAKNNAKTLARSNIKNNLPVHDLYAYHCRCKYIHLTKSPKENDASKKLVWKSPDKDFIEWAQTCQRTTKLGKHGKIK